MTFRESSVTLGTTANTVTRVTDEQRAQAVQGGVLTELIQSLYSLVLYDTVADSTLVSPGLDPAKRTTNAEYFFRVPPKSLEMQEPFNTTIQPTQDGGKYIESYGSIMKSVRISGTTGLRPNKGAPKTIPLFNVSADQLDTLLGRNLNDSVRGIPNEEKTGYDDIIFLRNIFRRYADIKATDALSSRVVMLWRNIKDADYWIVEPEDFRLTQNSGSPLTYEYSIALKTLARFDFSYATPEDSLAEARGRERMLSRLQDIGQNLLSVFMTISNQINRLQGFATYISNTILSPLLAVINGISAVKTSVAGVVRGLRTQALTLAGNLDAAIAQLAADESFEPQDVTIRAMRRTQLYLAGLLTEPPAEESDTHNVLLQLFRYSAAYETAGSLTSTRRAPPSSPTYIGYESLPAGVASGIVAPGETIRDVSARLLGDASRWRIIVTLNRLRSPFISAAGGPGVLAPGDTILYPAETGPASPVVGTQNPSDNQYSGPNDPVIRAYGRDLMVKSSMVGGTELTDLALNQAGDLATIQGLPNVEQALKLKFLTERRELPAHPKYGAKFPVGKKATTSSFNEFRINTINTLTSDPRVRDVKELRFIAVGDKLAAKIDLELVNASSIFPVTLALRRF